MYVARIRLELGVGEDGFGSEAPEVENEARSPTTGGGSPSVIKPYECS